MARPRRRFCAEVSRLRKACCATFLDEASLEETSPIQKCGVGGWRYVFGGDIGPVSALA